MYLPSDHSFVVCAYGESPFLEDCIESLLSQDALGSILIASSTPNNHITSLAKRFSLDLFINGGQPGIGSDWNFAVSCARSPLVTLAHQDDVYEPGYTRTMLAAMNRAQRPLLFFSNYGELRGLKTVDDNALLRIKRFLLRPLMKRGGVSGETHVKRSILKFGNAIDCPSATLNMSLLPSPPFKEDFGSNLDWDAWERFSLLDGEFVYSPEILMHHRIHAESTTTSLIGDNRRTDEDYRMLRRFWSAPVARLLNSVYSLAHISNG